LVLMVLLPVAADCVGILAEAALKLPEIPEGPFNEGCGCLSIGAVALALRHVSALFKEADARMAA